MKPILSLVKLVLLFLLLVQCSNPSMNQNPGFEKIQSDFISPSDDNSLWCYWYWIGDDISKEGITKNPGFTSLAYQACHRVQNCANIELQMKRKIQNPCS
jgi:hypothetical protein